MKIVSLNRNIERYKFLSELEKFFDYCIWERHQKELMQPYIDKQKELI